MARSTFYYNAKRLGQPDGYDAIRECIRTIYRKHHGRYGYRRITDQLHDDGIKINHKTVQKLMGQMGPTAKRKNRVGDVHENGFHAASPAKSDGIKDSFR